MTLSDLITKTTEAFAAQAAAFKARVASAKTNLDYLMAVGVVVTEDDARDNAYRAAYIAEQAKLAGVSAAAMEAAEDYARTFECIVYDVLRTATEGETRKEHTARFNEAIAKLPAKVAEGKKRPCTHKPTAKRPGWHSFGGGGENERYVCCGCGSVVEISYKRTAPTAAAVEALAFVHANYDTLAKYVLGFENYGIAKEVK